MNNVTLGLLLGDRVAGDFGVVEPGAGARPGTADRDYPTDAGYQGDEYAAADAAAADELSLTDEYANGGRVEREGVGGGGGPARLLAVLLCVGVASAALYLGLGGMMTDISQMAVWVSVIAITLSFSCLVALLAVAQFHIFRLEQRVKGMEREIETLTFELRRQEAENSQLMRRIMGDHK